MDIKFLSGGLRKKGILKKDKKNLPLISIITVFFVHCGAPLQSTDTRPNEKSQVGRTIRY